VSTIATFPRLPGPSGPREAVPTDVVVGPEGAYYVSTLTGFPFTAETANFYSASAGNSAVWRIVP
jgi:hypothetical protein